MNKLTIVNEYVCFASAGNAAIERAIQIDIEKAENASSMRADDVLHKLACQRVSLNYRCTPAHKRIRYCNIIQTVGFVEQILRSPSPNFDSKKP